MYLKNISVVIISSKVLFVPIFIAQKRGMLIKIFPRRTLLVVRICEKSFLTLENNEDS